MTMLLVVSAVLALAPAPDDLVELPMLEIGGLPPCNGDDDCPRGSPLCDTNIGECVECLGPEHCDEGWTCAPAGVCVDACEVDADCEGLGGRTLCDPETGTCVQCLGSADCPADEFCMEQLCFDDHCTPGESFCFGATIMLCLEDGGSTMTLETCEMACEDVDGTPTCTAPEGSTGEPSGTSGMSGTSSPDEGPASGSGPGPATDDGSTGSAPADEVGSRGCACQGAPASRAGWAGMLLLPLALAGRRRRRLAARGRPEVPAWSP
jgi:hypothetical protein